MSFVIKSEEHIALDSNNMEFDKILLSGEEDGGGGHHNGNVMENEKRMRREIANSNERRRMQSINAGFQSLKNLLPHHEGEKLSKAAILQQTAEYIYALEQEKTRLLSQNCQLKRLLDQNDNVAATAGELQTTTTNKKRKFDNVIQMQTISDSSDEGLGSMSPEPVTIFTVLHKNQQQQQTGIAPIKDIVEMKHQLEIERRQRINAEEQLRQLECQIYPERIRDVPIHYQHQEVIEHTNNVRDEEMQLSTITEQTLPNHHLVLHDENIAQNQIVICSTDIDNDDDETEDCCDEDDEELRPESPILQLQQHQIDIKEELQQKCEIVQLPKRPVTPQPPIQQQLSPPTNQRLQPILEAAIKAEPKVEVERINSPVKTNDETSATTTTTTDKTSKNQSRMFVTTSRQNLETIVEAIRHLEGDHLFGEVAADPQPTQEAPLALTNKPQPITRQLQFEMNPFLQFRNSNPAGTNLALTTTQTAISHHQLQQQRPGVIVVKQNS